MSDDALKELQRQIVKINASIDKLAGDHKTVTFGEFAIRVMADKLDNPTLRASTKIIFENQVKMHLIPAFGAMNIAAVNNIEFLKWVSKVRLENEKKGPKERKVTRFFGARKALGEILKAAFDSGLIDKMPKIDNPDSPRNVGRALSDKEVWTILRNTKNKSFRFFFYVLFKTGCRPQEVMRWEYSMFKWNEPGKTWISIPARISKTDRNRDIPINPIVSKRLYRQFRISFSPFVFDKGLFRPAKAFGPQLLYQGAWRNMLKKTGLRCVPYDFRRSFITRCASEGKPLIYVAKALDTSVKMIEAVYAKTQVQVMEDLVK